MFCPNCGAKAEGGKFCTSCGNPLPILPESAPKEVPQPTMSWETPAQNQAQPYQAQPYEAPQYQAQPYQAPQYQAGQYQAPQYQPEQYQAPENAETPAEPKGGKKKMKPWLWAVIGVGAALLFAGLVVLGIILFAKNDPTAQVAVAAAKSMDAVKKTEAGKFAGELEKSEVKLGVDLQKIANGQIPLNAAAEVTMSQDLEAGKMSLILSVLVKGKELADLGFYMDDKDLAVTSDTLLGDDVYGLTFKTLPDDLKKSIFAPDSGSDFELPDEIYNILSQIDESPYAMYKEGRGAFKELAEAGGKKLLESLKKNAEISKDEGKLTVGKSSQDCRIVKAEADEEATRAIVEDMVAWLKEEATREKLERFFSVYAKIGNIVNGGNSKKDAEDLLDDFYKELDNSVKEMKDSESDITFYISKDNGQLIGFEAEYESGKDQGSLKFAAGPDFESPEEIRVEIDSNGEETIFTYEVKENSDSAYKAEVTVENDDKQSFTFDWKKKRGGFTISREGFPLVEGNLSIDEDSLAVEIDKIGLSLEVTKGAKTEDVPEFTNIVRLTEDEFKDLFRDLSNEIQKLILKFL